MDGPRANQRLRTRKDLLAAAARLMSEGKAPTLETVAAEALVSRATAYRYFPSIEALLVEAGLDVAFPDPEDTFRSTDTTDPAARLQMADAAVQAMVSANEPALRQMLIHSLQLGRDGDRPMSRQNRRGGLIAAALEPARGSFDSEDFELLSRAMALVIGTESMLVFKDVLHLDERESARVKRWMIGALVQAAERS